MLSRLSPIAAAVLLSAASGLATPESSPMTAAVGAGEVRSVDNFGGEVRACTGDYRFGADVVGRHFDIAMGGDPDDPCRTSLTWVFADAYNSDIFALEQEAECVVQPYGIPGVITFTCCEIRADLELQETAYNLVYAYQCIEVDGTIVTGTVGVRFAMTEDAVRLEVHQRDDQGRWWDLEGKLDRLA